MSEQINGDGVNNTDTTPASLRYADDAALLAISRVWGLGLDTAEMRAIQVHFRRVGREPTVVELQTLGTVWGALAALRVLSAVISYDGPPPGPDGNAPAVRQTIDGLLPRDLRQAGIDPDHVLSDIGGATTSDGRWQITHDGQVAGDLPLSFLLDGWPRRMREARWRPPAPTPTTADESETTCSLGAHLPAMLAQHDPLSGTYISTDGENITPAAASASELWLKTLPDSRAADRSPSRMVSITAAAPSYGELDPYRMAWAGVDKVMGTLVCAGADPQTAVLAPVFRTSHLERPERLGALIRALQGFEAAVVAHGSQIIRNGFALPGDETDPTGAPSIHESLHIRALAELSQDSSQLGSGFRQAGDFIFMIGQTRPELGGSLYSLIGGKVRPQHRHAPGPIEEPRTLLMALHQALRAGLVRAGARCGEGGMGLALAGLCIAGDQGADIQMRAVPVDPYYAYAADEAILFSESLGRFLVEVRPEDAAEFSAALGSVVHACIGIVGGTDLRLHARLPMTADPPLSIGVDALRRSLSSDHPDSR